MDTKTIKGKNNESGTFTQTLSVSEVGTAHVSPVPREAPGVVVAKIGTSEEEHIYYRAKDDGAGTISGLIRDYSNLNGGTGREHVATSAWETAQSIEYVNNLVDAIQQGYHQEMNTIAYVGATQLTVATDQTSFYTAGRILRFNQDNTKIAIVATSSYSSGTGLTTVTINYGTVPESLTHVEMAIMPKGATSLIATAAGVQNSSYAYAADGGSTDEYAITLTPAPTAYAAGQVFMFKANTDNTGPTTLNVNSLGAKTIKKDLNSDLETGDIKAGQMVTVMYDGTNLQLLSRSSAISKGELRDLTPSAQATPGLTIKVAAGKVMVGQTFVNYAGGNSPTVTAPSANPRIDVLTIDSAGTLAWTAGSESASPTMPAIPTGKIPICAIYNRVGETSIKDVDDATNGYIQHDLRTFLQDVPASGGSTDGWTLDAYTWVYASASTFTIAGVDLTAVFQKGTRLRFKQGAGYKYAVVVASSFSTNTTVTIAVNNDYTIANAAITDNYYSYSVRPQGYPSYFSYTPTLTKPTGMTGTPSIQFAVFQIIGTWCHVKMMWSGSFAGTVTGTSWTMSLPVNGIGVAGSPRYTGVGYAERVGAAITIIYAYSDLANMNLRMYNNAAFAAGDQEYDAEIFYPI